MMDRALTIGINQYQSPDVPPLRGCVPDAADMARLLVDTVRIDAGQVLTLLDADATAQNIRLGMIWLRDGAAPGDRRVLHLSSHGTRVPDDDRDEADGYDEAICPHDLDWSRPQTLIRDDELGRWVATFPAGVHLTLIFDCCHSGTGTREITPPGMPSGPTVSTRSVRHRGPRVDLKATAARARAAGSGIAPERQPYVSPHLVLARFAPPPPDLEAKAEPLPPRRRAARAVTATADSVLYAACQPDQTAADAYLGGGFRGAFTYHFCKVMRETEGEIDRAELVERLKRAMKAGRFSQVPQLEAAGPRGVVLGKMKRSG